MVYEIWHEQKCKNIMVDENWLEGVNVKRASKFSYDGVDKLYVTYNENTKYEKHVVYKKYFGSWGFPTTLA